MTAAIFPFPPRIPRKPNCTAIVRTIDGCFRALYEVHVIDLEGCKRKIASELFFGDAFKLADELADRIELEGEEDDFPF
jgi:hypothetical protein